MNTTPQHRKLMPKALLSCLALGVAGGVWWASSRTSQSGAAPIQAASAASLVDVLDAIPRSTGAPATDLAIAKWTAKARRNPNDARALVSLGDALMQHVRETADAAYYARAQHLYQKALALEPRNGEAITGLAWVSCGRHQFDESVVWARQALAINPRNNAAYGLIGDAAVEQGDYPTAFKSYQKMLDLRPDLSSYSRGAHLLHITGRFRADLIKSLRGLATDDAHIAKILGLVQERGDILRVKLDVPNTGPQGGNNMGGGYPMTGRRLVDDVVDGTFTTINNDRPLSDFVNGNELPFRNTFPFVHDPTQPFPPGQNPDDHTRQ